MVGGVNVLQARGADESQDRAKGLPVTGGVKEYPRIREEDDPRKHLWE